MWQGNCINNIGETMANLGKKEILEELEKLGIDNVERNAYLKDYTDYFSSHHVKLFSRWKCYLKYTLRKILSIPKKNKISVN
jgi:hypothetical protein